MTPPDPYDFEKLAREIITQRLEKLDDNYTSIAVAEIAKKIIVTAVKSTKVRQSPKVTVTQICRGALNGAMFIGKDLKLAAMDLLRMMPDIALKTNLDPGDLMTWGMEGIAGVMPVAGMEVRSAIRAKIEEEFMGAGDIFSTFCDKAQKSK